MKDDLIAVLNYIDEVCETLSQWEVGNPTTDEEALELNTKYLATMNAKIVPSDSVILKKDIKDVTELMKRVKIAKLVDEYANKLIYSLFQSIFNSLVLSHLQQFEVMRMLAVSMKGHGKKTRETMRSALLHVVEEMEQFV